MERNPTSSKHAANSDPSLYSAWSGIMIDFSEGTNCDRQGGEGGKEGSSVAPHANLAYLRI